MKYNDTLKLSAVEMYGSGQWMPTPERIWTKNVRKRMVQWSKKLAGARAYLSFKPISEMSTK